MPEQFLEQLITKKITICRLKANQLFHYFASHPWAMLLDSANCDHIDSRFDIIVAQPKVKIVTRGNHTEVTTVLNGIDNSVVSTDDPLKIVQQQIAANLKVQSNPTQLPFIGGAIGYFAYDLGGSFEALSRIATDDIGTPDMAVGIYDWAIIKDNHDDSLWFVSQDQSLDTAVPGFTEFCQSTSAIPITTKEQPFQLTTDWQANMNFAAYADKFAAVQQHLLNGDCYQINLAQRFDASYQGDEYSAYCTLAEQNKAPFSAFLRFEQFSILSISPERLLQLNHRQIQTKPIKGTAVRADDPQVDQQNAIRLSQSAKDRAENVMIVDLLRNDIGKVSVSGSVKVPSLFAIESFPAVHHLVSTVTGVLSRQFQATDLLRSAFPGGSITGAPKINAMMIIDQLEPHRRSAYCGSIGYICASGNMDTSITIRTLVCKKDKNNKSATNRIFCWAGGAIVADSQVDSEYQETYDKVNKILPVLAAI